MTNRDYNSLKRRITKHFEGAQKDILLQMLDRQKATDTAFKLQAQFNGNVLTMSNQLGRLIDVTSSLAKVTKKIMVHVGMAEEVEPDEVKEETT